MKYFLYLIILFHLCLTATAQHPKIGNLITNSDGSKGIVFWVSPDGSGGWMVALHDLTPGFWGKANVHVPGLTNIPWDATNDFIPTLRDTSGYQNTTIIRQFQGPGNEYAAQKVDFENGWYLPAVGQVHKLKLVWSQIKPTILDNGGMDLIEIIYWTSSQLNNRFAWTAHGGDNIRINHAEKELTQFYGGTRPIRSFTNTNLTYRWSTGDTTPSVTVRPDTTTDYQVTMTSTEGWSTTATQRITVNPSYTIPLHKTISKGESYDFRGRVVTEPGVYDDSLKTTLGCDSIYRLTLTLGLPSYLSEDSAQICDKESFLFRGEVLTETGVYDDTLRTAAGTDSIFRLHLTVNPTHLLESRIAICENETHDFRGKTYNTTGIYDDSLKTMVTGCDSIYRLHLTVNPIYNLEESATICQGEIYDFHGQKLTTSGVYRDSLKTAAGCDSVYRLTLTVSPTYLFPENGVICQGEEYNFRGRKFNSTGVYDDTLKTVAGCDSIFRLHLTVNPTHLLESHVAICKGETHHFRGETYNETGVYDDSLKTTATGCDSIYRLYLTVNPTYNFEESATICQGEMYDFHGQKLTTSGVYRDSLKTAAGCDSVYRLTLTVDPIYLFPENGVICQGEEYNFRGRKYNSAGVYDDALKTVSGCDSIFRLHLTVNPTYHPVIDTLICRGERYLANGFDETESGEYTQSLTTAHGCDSIVTLKLRVVDYFDGDIDVALEDCRTHEYRFTAMNRGTADDYSYLWNLGDGTTSTETETLHHYADSGTYPVTLTVTTAHRCAKEMSVPVQVPYFSEDFEITAEPAEIDDAHPEISFSTACVPGLAYLWDFGDGAIGTGCKTAHQYALREKSWYQVRLTVSNREDCSTEEEMQIMSWSKVKGINTFSPNGDGINDIFRPGFHVKVFNRNGLLIFEGDDGWDGTYKGKQVPADVYFYEAEHLSTQGTRKDNGYITVIR